MMGSDKACQGTGESLTACSRSYLLSTGMVSRLWTLKQQGLVKTGRRILRRAAGPVLRRVRHTPPGETSGQRAVVCREILDLTPGEMVEVKSEEEIRATLDAQGKCRGLYWMPRMARFCGGRYRVYKRMERLMLESNGELRKLRNTVLLEGVTCEGLSGCDRSCFHFWREAWLHRVPDDLATIPSPKSIRQDDRTAANTASAPPAQSTSLDPLSQTKEEIRNPTGPTTVATA